MIMMEGEITGERELRKRKKIQATCINMSGVNQKKKMLPSPTVILKDCKSVLDSNGISSVNVLKNTTHKSRVSVVRGSPAGTNKNRSVRTNAVNNEVKQAVEVKSTVGCPDAGKIDAISIDSSKVLNNTPDSPCSDNTPKASENEEHILKTLRKYTFTVPTKSTGQKDNSQSEGLISNKSSVNSTNEVRPGSVACSILNKPNQSESGNVACWVLKKPSYSGTAASSVTNKPGHSESVASSVLKEPCQSVTQKARTKRPVFSILTVAKSALSEPGSVESSASNKPGIVESSVSNKPGIVESSVSNKPGIVESSVSNKPGIVESSVSNKPGIVESSVSNKSGIVASSVSNRPGNVATQKAHTKMPVFSSVLPQPTSVCMAMKQYNSNLRKSHDLRKSQEQAPVPLSSMKTKRGNNSGYTRTPLTTIRAKKVIDYSIAAPYDLTAERNGVQLSLSWKYESTADDIDGFVIMESKDNVTWTDCRSIGKTVRRVSFTYFLDQKKKDWYIGICSYRRTKFSLRATLHLATLSHPDTLSNDLLNGLLSNRKPSYWETCSSYMISDRNTSHRTIDNHSMMEKPIKNSPNCTTIQSSFYNVLCSPINCAPLPPDGVKATKRGTQNIGYQFGIDQTLSSIMLASREQVFDSHTLRVMVRMCEMKQTESPPQEDEIPDCIISVNSKVTLVQMDNKHLGSLDLTDKCKFSKYLPSINTLGIEWMPNNKHYCLNVSVVRMLDIEGVISKLMQSNIRPASVTENKIKSILKSDSGLDSDISYTSLKTQLICPLGKSRIVTPCRGSYCTHLYCMDALTLLKLNEKRPLSKKKCFMCDQPLEFIYVDGLFLNILRCVPETVNEVEFDKSGSWSYPNHTNNANDDNKSVYCEASLQHSPLKKINGKDDLRTSNDSKKESDSFLTTQLEKVKLQLDRLSNLTSNTINDEVTKESNVFDDDHINISTNTEEFVTDTIDLTEEETDCVYIDIDDKTGILDEIYSLPDVVPAIETNKRTSGGCKDGSLTRRRGSKRSQTPDATAGSPRRGQGSKRSQTPDATAGSPRRRQGSKRSQTPDATAGFPSKRQGSKRSQTPDATAGSPKRGQGSKRSQTPDATAGSPRRRQGSKRSQAPDATAGSPTRRQGSKRVHTPDATVGSPATRQGSKRSNTLNKNDAIAGSPTRRQGSKRVHTPDATAVSPATRQGSKRYHTLEKNDATAGSPATSQGSKRSHTPDKNDANAGSLTTRPGCKRYHTPDKDGATAGPPAKSPSIQTSQTPDENIASTILENQDTLNLLRDNVTAKISATENLGSENEQNDVEVVSVTIQKPKRKNDIITKATYNHRLEMEISRLLQQSKQTDSVSSERDKNNKTVNKNACEKEASVMEDSGIVKGPKNDKNKKCVKKKTCRRSPRVTKNSLNKTNQVEEANETLVKCTNMSTPVNTECKNDQLSGTSTETRVMPKDDGTMCSNITKVQTNDNMQVAIRETDGNDINTKCVNKKTCGQQTSVTQGSPNGGKGTKSKKCKNINAVSKVIEKIINSGDNAEMDETAQTKKQMLNYQEQITNKSNENTPLTRRSTRVAEANNAEKDKTAQTNLEQIIPIASKKQIVNPQEQILSKSNENKPATRRSNRVLEATNQLVKCINRSTPVTSNTECQDDQLPGTSNGAGVMSEDDSTMCSNITQVQTNDHTQVCTAKTEPDDSVVMKELCSHDINIGHSDAISNNQVIDDGGAITSNDDSVSFANDDVINDRDVIANSDVIDASEVIDNSNVLDGSEVLDNGDLIHDSEVSDNIDVIDNSDDVYDSKVIDSNDVIDSSAVLGDSEVIDSSDNIDAIDDSEVSDNSAVLGESNNIDNNDVIDDCEVLDDCEVIDDLIDDNAVSSPSVSSHSSIPSNLGVKTPVSYNYDKYKTKKLLSSEKKSKTLPRIVPFVVDSYETKESPTTPAEKKYRAKRFSNYGLETKCKSVSNCVPFIVDCGASTNVNVNESNNESVKVSKKKVPSITDLTLVESKSSSIDLKLVETAEAKSESHSIPGDKQTDTGLVNVVESGFESDSALAAENYVELKQIESKTETQSAANLSDIALDLTSPVQENVTASEDDAPECSEVKNIAASRDSAWGKSEVTKEVNNKAVSGDNALGKSEVTEEVDKVFSSSSDIHMDDLTQSQLTRCKTRNKSRLQRDEHTRLSVDASLLTPGYPYIRRKPSLAPATKRQMRFMKSGLIPNSSDRRSMTRTAPFRFFTSPGLALTSPKLQKVFQSSIPSLSTVPARAVSEERRNTRSPSTDSLDSDIIEIEIDTTSPGQCSTEDLDRTEQTDNVEHVNLLNDAEIMGQINVEPYSKPQSPNQHADVDVIDTHIKTQQVEEEKNVVDIISPVRKSPRKSNSGRFKEILESVKSSRRNNSNT